MRLVAVNLQLSEPDGLFRAAANEAVVPRDALIFRRPLSSALRRSDIPEPDEKVTTGAFARQVNDPAWQLRTLTSLATGGR